MAFDQTMLDEAAAWAVKTSDSAFADWDGFTRWLEGDPDRAAAYDHVMAAADDGAALAGLRTVPPMPAATEPPAANHAANDAAIDFARSEKRRLVVGALAACLTVFAALWVWSVQSADLVYRTQAGETRRIALGDGSAVVLAGASELAIDRADERSARLERGRALFEIRHDDSDPFRLAVGTAMLVDAGTVFDVNIRAAEVAVAVSEGAVVYNPARQNARIDPGQELVFDRGSAAYRLVALPRDQVGEWQAGRLTFRDAPLADVAADIARASGIAYRVAADSGTQRISGSIALDRLRANPAALGPLLGLEVTRRDDGWMLAAP